MAVTELDRALARVRNDRERARVLVQRAVALYQLQKYQEAFVDIDRAIALDAPKSISEAEFPIVEPGTAWRITSSFQPWWYALRGELHRKLGRTEAAKRDMDLAKAILEVQQQ